jgi:hypothetical protein
VSVPGAGVAVNFPGLPEFEKRDSKDTTNASHGGTTTQKLSDVQQQALGGIDQAAEAQKAGTGEVRTQAEKIAGVEAQGALDEQAAAKYKLDQLTSPAAYDADIAVSRARDNVKEQQARYAAMPPPSLFAAKDGWGKMRTAVSIGLAGMADAARARASILAGQGMPTYSTVTQLVEGEIARQKAAIDKQKDSVVMSRTGLSDAEDARRQLRGDIDLKAMAMLDNAKRLTTARLAAAKMDQPAIDQHQAILAIDAKKADLKADYVKGLTTTVQSGWDKSTKVGVDETHRAPTAGGGGGGVEADKNAAQFDILRQHGRSLAEQMKSLSPDDIKAINVATSSGDWLKESPAWTAVFAKAGLDEETGVSSAAKRYIEDLHRADQAIGRLESGAAIGKTEAIDFRNKFKPKISDKPEDISMRSNNILQDVNSWGAHVDRPARAPVPSPAPAAPGAAAAAPAKTQFRRRAPITRTALIKKLKAQPKLQYR